MGRPFVRAFEPAGLTPGSRTQLRLGEISDAARLGLTAGVCPYRDTARVKLGKTPPPGEPDDANAALLTTDLPLPLYILLELQIDPTIAGSHMGPLGSIIVGETIFRRLTSEEDKLTSLIPAAKQALGADWDSIESVKSMPDLVRLAEDWGNLKNCPQMPFIAA